MQTSLCESISVISDILLLEWDCQMWVCLWWSWEQTLCVSSSIHIQAPRKFHKSNAIFYDVLINDGPCLLPPCISPAPEQRSAGRIDSVDVLGRSCGTGPQRWRHVPAWPDEGSGTLGCLRWAQNTGSAGWTLRPWEKKTRTHGKGVTMVSFMLATTIATS